MKHTRFDIKESLFQQYIFAQSQHQRHRNRDKYLFNTSLLPSPGIYAFTKIQQ